MDNKKFFRGQTQEALKAERKYFKADKPCQHIWRNVTGQDWLKCMECGVVRD
jgi:hypothetical protein